MYLEQGNLGDLRRNITVWFCETARVMLSPHPLGKWSPAVAEESALRRGAVLLSRVSALREDVPLLPLPTVTYTGSFFKPEFLLNLQMCFSDALTILAKCTGCLGVSPYSPHWWWLFLALIYSSCLSFHQRRIKSRCSSRDLLSAGSLGWDSDAGTEHKFGGGRGQFSELCGGAEPVTAVLCNDAAIYAACNAAGLFCCPISLKIHA